MKKTRLVRIQSLFVLVAVMMTMLPAFSASTMAEEKTIKVGTHDVPGLLEVDAEGKYSGYAAEYLNEITKYTGWEYEFIYNSWDKLLDMLEKGEIDVLCTAQYSTARDEIYDYSDAPLGYEGSKLYTRLDDDRFYFDDFTAFDGMTVAALQKNFLNGVFETYAKENHFAFSFK